MISRAALHFLAFAALAMSVIAGAGGCDSTPRSAPTSIQVAASAAPLSIRASGLFFIAEAQTEAGPTLRLLVDTGAARTFVDETSSHQFPKTSFRGTRERVRSANGVIVNLEHELELETLSIGPLTVKNLRAPVLDLSGVRQTLGTPIDGVLGWDVLRVAVMTFDYPTSTMRISPATPRPPLPPASGAQLLGTNDVAVTTLALADRSTRAVVDTGSDGHIAVASLKSLPRKGRIRPGGSVRGVGGARRTRVAELDGNAIFGGATIPNPTISETDGLPRVGAAALQHGTLTIDGPRNLVWFTPAS